MTAWHDASFFEASLAQAVRPRPCSRRRPRISRSITGAAARCSSSVRAMPLADQQPGRHGLQILRQRTGQRTVRLSGARAHCVSAVRAAQQRKSKSLLNDVDLHLRNPRSDHPQLLGGRVRDVDNPSQNERTTVIDPDRHGATGFDIGDAQARAERQRAVSSGQFLRIELLAARGPSVVVAVQLAIPCDASGVSAGGFFATAATCRLRINDAFRVGSGAACRWTASDADLSLTTAG